LADDRQLWERICQGDARTFDAFYRENAPRLEAFLRHVVGNRQAAEDLMQDTFTQIWRRPNGFQPERGTLRAYLYGIGRKRAAEWWRTQGNRGAIVEDDLAACRTETTSAVNEAFLQLAKEQRILLWLREVEGHSYVELSEVLEIPVGTVRSRLFAAREALRRIWQSPRQRPKEST
jgi:RNA polymerase sigma-70 factor (ECF subfamily)